MTGVSESSFVTTSLDSRGLRDFIEQRTLDYVAIFDAKGRVRYINGRLQRVLRLKIPSVSGERLEDLGLPEELLHSWQVALSQVFASGQRCRAEFAVGKSGRLRETSFYPIQGDDDEVVEILAVTRDISQRRALSSGLRTLATQDPLTGLVNRRGFEAELSIALESAQQAGHHHALCFLDLDDFKVVNDICGHSAGDSLLRQLPPLMRAVLRMGDSLGRLGGDEFGVLLRDCELRDAVRIAESLRDAIRGFRFSWQGRSFVVGVSIGVVAIGATSRGLESVLAEADAACYTAKDRGRNTVYAAQPHDLAVIRRRGEMRWADRVRTALEHEDGFCLHYQSIFVLGGNAVPEHHELLLRMNDVSGQPVLPGAFLPAAERAGLMADIDRWVVDASLAAIAPLLMAAACGHRFSINLSSSALTDPLLLEYIGEALARHRVDPGAVYFEIRETAASQNLGAALNLLRGLRQMGCRIALDEFGSGVASFSYLKNLPVDLIKIDGSIVMELLGNPVEEAIVRAINDVAHRLEIGTVAGAVENSALLGLLGEIGVDFAQGFALAKPRPLSEFS